MRKVKGRARYRRPYRRADRFPRRGERDLRIADGEGPGCGFGLALQRPRKALAQGAQDAMELYAASS
jgi:hypothetical protein